MVNKREQKIDKIVKFLKQNPSYVGVGASILMPRVNEYDSSLIKEAKLRFRNSLKTVTKEEEVKDNTTDLILKFIKKTKNTSIENISNEFDISVKVVRESLDNLKHKGYAINEFSNNIEIGSIASGGSHDVDISKISPSDRTKVTYEFGYITDEHLGSKYQRLDVVNAAFEHFKNKGIKQVYNTGNWIDGVIHFNKNDIFLHNMESQVDYMVKNYPSIEGIDFYFISGEDHEGWFTRREGINVGNYLQMKAREAGREDFHHLGFMEADVILKAPNGECRMRLIHPGGGSSYAVSYKPQKIVESYTSGEKPNILLVGHYHKAGYFYNRGVHIVLGGTACDQTPFMRKNNIAAHVGFWTIKVSLDLNGAVTEFQPTFHPFYDKDYYNDDDTWKFKWD